MSFVLASRAAQVWMFSFLHARKLTVVYSLYIARVCRTVAGTWMLSYSSFSAAMPENAEAPTPVSCWFRIDLPKTSTPEESMSTKIISHVVMNTQ